MLLAENAALSVLRGVGVTADFRWRMDRTAGIYEIPQMIQRKT
jgi:hypothetical protein